MILDTGADMTALTVAAVERLQLPRDEWVSTLSRGAGGRVQEYRNVSPASMLLGGVALRRRGVVSKPSLLGDCRHRQRPAGRTAGRRSAVAVRPRSRSAGANADAVFRAGLRGAVHPVGSALRGGSGCSSACARGACRWFRCSSTTTPCCGARYGRVGFVPQPARHAPAGPDAGDAGRRPGGRGVRGRRQDGEPACIVSRRLQIGSLVVQEPTLLTAPVPTRIFDMLLGVDFWSARRLWISYATSQIFIAVK